MKKLSDFIVFLALLQKVEEGTLRLNPRRKFRNRRMQMIWCAMLVIKHPRVVLDLSDKWHERVATLRDVYDSMNANIGGYFTPGPTTPTLAQFLVLINELAQLVQDVIENKTDAKVNRDAKWDETYAATQNLIAYVQILVRARPAQAAQIAAEAQMRLKITKGKLPQGFTAVSKAEGQIETTGAIKKSKQCNDWQICVNPENDANWLLIKVQPTNAANTKITGLKSGEIYYVRHMAITTKGDNVWTEPIRVRVK
jgi:hypothetical protein